MKDLQDKTVVITGGASGIGLGMARAFAGRGARLVIADLDEGALQAAQAEFEAGNTPVVTSVCDVSDYDAVRALADTACDAFGGVNVLCSNAGVGIPTPTEPERMKLKDWKWIIDVDLWGPIYGVEVFLPIIEAQGEGHINATSSMAGLIASARMGAYNVAKHGVVALMASLERELRSRKSPVHASVLCPGPINTNISFHSVQYRPGQQKPKADGEKSGAMAKSIQSALEQGMPPDEVGEIVAKAVENDDFWVFTHPRWNKTLQKQLDALNEDRSLIRA